MKKIAINTKEKYDVYIGSGILKNCAQIIKGLCNPNKIVLVTDDIVEKLYAHTVISSLEKIGITVFCFTFKNGEASKNHTTLLELYAFMCECGVTRSDLLIALGGGVVGDLAGFAAATYMRGIGYIQIPTTLLAQIDSSVGGKTAVDIKSGKNLVGAFLQPKCVICDIETLKTLPENIFNSGMAEAIKYGLIKDRLLFEQILSGDIHLVLEDIISRCIAIKAEIVSNDEFESGERMLLNFGHTLGHGIEKYYNFSKLSHGEAVALGMVIITKASEKLGITKKGVADNIIKCLKRYSLPSTINITAENLALECVNDKKSKGSELNIILLKDLGDAVIYSINATDLAKFIKGEN